MDKVVKKPRKYRTYTAEYRAEAIRLARESGSVEKTAVSLGVSAHTLGSWVRGSKSRAQQALVKNASGQSMLELEAENKRLAKALDLAERTNKVLRLAAAFFSQDQLASDMRSLKK